MRSKERRVSHTTLLLLLQSSGMIIAAASLQVVSAELSRAASHWLCEGRGASCAQRGVDGWRDGEKEERRDGFLPSNRA